MLLCYLSKKKNLDVIVPNRTRVVLYPAQMSEKKPFVVSLVLSRNFGLIKYPFGSFSLIFLKSYVLAEFLKICVNLNDGQVQSKSKEVDIVMENHLQYVLQLDYVGIYVFYCCP
jgi:hypothetical protein